MEGEKDGESVTERWNGREMEGERDGISVTERWKGRVGRGERWGKCDIKFSIKYFKIKQVIRSVIFA